MGILSDLIWGGDKEYHERDGSSTERYSDGTSTTRNSDGSLRERTTHETVFPLGLGDKITTTYDDHGRVVNVQNGWGKH
jgi:hypothetical protein